jgi:hypothetical protein
MWMDECETQWYGNFVRYLVRWTRKRFDKNPPGITQHIIDFDVGQPNV